MNKDLQNAIEQDEELTQELTSEEILMNEDDILAGILACAGLKTSAEAYSTIEIRQAGGTRRIVKYDDKPTPFEQGEKTLVRFRIRGLDQEEYTKCRENATKYIRNPKMAGVKTPSDFNQVKFYDSLIYTATHPDDKAKLWDNQAAWKRLNILTGQDMVSTILYYGEKNAIVELIDDKSGFNDESLSMEEVAKKS